MTHFNIISSIIQERRTVKPVQMNGKSIPREQLEQILALAHWAPTHAHTEPWHFFVYHQASLQQFGADHAQLYNLVTLPEQHNPATFQKLLNMGVNASHLVVAVMKRGANPKIPFVEEYAAASAAVEHILLACQAAGIASFWSTGGLTHHNALKQYLQLQPEDAVVGLLYLGYTDTPPKAGKRVASIQQKITWHEGS
jgi:nitroreductase